MAPQHVGSVDGLMVLSGLFKEQQLLLLERDEKAKQDAKAERVEMDARMQSQRAEMEARMNAKIAELTPQEAVSAEQLATLQARLETIHQAKLLTEEELFTLEDLCADYAELKSTVGTVTKEMTTLHKLVGVSEQVAGDAAFARQVRRKFAAK